MYRFHGLVVVQNSDFRFQTAFKVLRNDPGVLRNDPGVLRNVLGMFCNILGVLRNVLGVAQFPGCVAQ